MICLRMIFKKNKYCFWWPTVLHIWRRLADNWSENNSINVLFILLRTFYVNLLHFTCLAHGLHRVAEKIRDEFKKADQLISSTKQVFLKAPQRVAIYRQLCPDLPTVPKPVLTRWGTWLSAVAFYWQNFDSVKIVLFFIAFILYWYIYTRLLIHSTHRMPPQFPKVKNVLRRQSGRIWPIFNQISADSHKP